MDEPPYAFEEDNSEYSYRFRSVSKQKVVEKLVLFTATDITDVYNLALVDILPDGNLSDSTVSNNDDMSTILATVFSIIDAFLNRFPTFIVLFQGSDERRIVCIVSPWGKKQTSLTGIMKYVDSMAINLFCLRETSLINHS